MLRTYAYFEGNLNSWLIKKHNLKPDLALDYLMQLHVGTNPLPEQLAVFKEDEFIKGEV